jgi:hypothetical protein
MHQMVEHERRRSVGREVEQMDGDEGCSVGEADSSIGEPHSFALKNACLSLGADLEV